MNHYAPRQHAVTKRWDYTCANDGRIWPVGYCSDHRGTHETPEEAAVCYKNYLLDTQLNLDQTMANQKRECEVDGCGEWTQGVATIGPGISFVLCDGHRNRGTVEGMFSVGESWSSY